MQALFETRVYLKSGPLFCVICDRFVSKLQSMAMANKSGKDKVTKGDNTNKSPPVGKTKGHFPCSVCDSVCASEAARKRHMVTHTGEKNFQCSLCLKKFTQNGNLKTHINLVHSNITRFECDVLF